MKKFRSAKWYRYNYPMNSLQMAAHKEACRRVVEHYKDVPNLRVSQSSIEKILIGFHILFKTTFACMHVNKKPDDPSVVYTGFGYIRKTFPALFIQMYENGEFTDKEWEVIRGELYKKQIDIHQELIANRKTFKNNDNGKNKN